MTGIKPRYKILESRIKIICRIVQLSGSKISLKIFLTLIFKLQLYLLQKSYSYYFFFILAVKRQTNGGIKYIGYVVKTTGGVMLLVYPMRAPAVTTSLPVLFPCKLGGAENDCKSPGKEIAADRKMSPV